MDMIRGDTSMSLHERYVTADMRTHREQMRLKSTRAGSMYIPADARADLVKVLKAMKVPSDKADSKLQKKIVLAPCGFFDARLVHHATPAAVILSVENHAPAIVLDWKRFTETIEYAPEGAGVHVEWANDDTDTSGVRITAGRMEATILAPHLESLGLELPPVKSWEYLAEFIVPQQIAGLRSIAGRPLAGELARVVVHNGWLYVASPHVVARIDIDGFGSAALPAEAMKFLKAGTHVIVERCKDDTKITSTDTGDSTVCGGVFVKDPARVPRFVDSRMRDTRTDGPITIDPKETHKRLDALARVTPFAPPGADSASPDEMRAGAPAQSSLADIHVKIGLGGVEFQSAATGIHEPTYLVECGVLSDLLRAHGAAESALLFVAEYDKQRFIQVKSDDAWSLCMLLRP